MNRDNFIIKFLLNIFYIWNSFRDITKKLKTRFTHKRGDFKRFSETDIF